MTSNGRILSKRLQRVQMFRQMHLIVQSMHPAVAGPTQIDPAIQFVPAEPFSKERPAMHLARNQMVEGENSLAMAQLAQ